MTLAVAWWNNLSISISEYTSILETMSTEGITNVITDDGDFVTIPGIKVFTCNINAINAAQIQGKLIVRS